MERRSLVSGGTNYLYLFVHYIVATQLRTTVEEFVDAVQQHNIQIGGEMVTLAEEWLKEGEARGEAKGEIKAKLETVERLLKLGMDWPFIEQATGVDQLKFQTLKRQLAQLMQASKEQGAPKLTT